MRIHREGHSTLITLGTLLGFVTAVAYAILPDRAFRLVAFAAAATFGLVAQFFRDPPRITPTTEGLVIAPADGTIVAVEPVTETEYFRDQRLKVSIYMSVLNVHVNRAPITGRVIYHRYHPGQYLVAFHPKASELNERNTVILENRAGQQVLVRQIAGLLARRIRWYIHVAQWLQAGDELGFIKFGSRCDVFLPLDADVRVYLDQQVTGGETVLASLKRSEDAY